MSQKVTVRIGDELSCEIGSGAFAREGEWQVFCQSVPEEWEGKLISREKRLYQPKDADWFWVFRVHYKDRRYWVSDSNFGRFPISDRQRPKYRRAVLAFLSALDDGPLGDDQAFLNDLSEMKGIFNRCRRGDQWDWFTLYEYLGRPPKALLDYAVDQFQMLRKAIKTSDSPLFAECVTGLSLAIPREMLRGFLHQLETNMPRLGFHPLFGTAGVEAVPPQLVAIPRPMDEDARIKLERANHDHARTLDLLRMMLSALGYTVEHNRLIDLFCRLKTGPAIFEVKSINGTNERTQCRHAISQLYEYRYLHGLGEASLWVILSEKPSASWLIDYLMADRELHVLWVEKALLAGPSLGALA
jgi:hypothetical protein